MTQKIKFYLDEHVPKVVAKGLKRRGIDALTVSEADMLGASDEEHLIWALKEGRVIFTQDDDFLRLHTTKKNHAGIVYTHQGKSIGDIISGLTLIHQVLDSDDMENHVEFL